MAKRGWLPHVGLAALFLITIAFEIRFTFDSIRSMLHATEVVQLPFLIGSPGTTLIRIKPETTRAGLMEGDHLVSIDNRPVRGLAELADIVHQHRVGDLLSIAADRNGTAIRSQLRLAPQNETPLTAKRWMLISILNYVTPWFCILLGFGVAFIRPRDPLAWLLLLLLLSFAQVADGDSFMSTLAGWELPFRAAAIFYFSFFSGMWAVMMMLFGQYFPDRVADRWQDRALRWGLGLPIVSLAVANAFSNVVELEDANAGLSGVMNHLGIVALIAMMLAIGSFFGNVLTKASKATSPDNRRRLNLLYAGSTISLTPIFLVTVAVLITGKTSFTNVPEWIVVPSLVMLFLFPVTLAYVIVVEKAMELRVAVRQGLQYALATRGARLLMGFLVVGILFITMRLLNDPNVKGPRELMVLAVMLLIVVRLRKLMDTVRGWIDRRFFREAVNTENVLSELGDKVRRIVEVHPLLATVTSTIGSTLHVPRIAALLRENGDYTMAHAMGFAARPLVRFRADSAVTERLARTGEAVRVSFNRDDSWMLEERKNLEALSSELLLPLAVKDRLLGFLSLGPKRSEEPYTATDVQLLQSVAAQTGLALENSRLTEAVASEVAQRERLNRELEIAREVQQRLFPQYGPQIPGLDYVGKCRPASSVGGDYYDFVAMCDGRLGIAIGDISGKGVPAALLMASLQASLRGLAIANPPALSSLMSNLNRLIYDASPSNRYATFFYGVYDPKTLEFVYVNGGHNPPMVFRGTEVLRLEEGGPVVGLFGPAQYEQAVIQLLQSDTIVFFTDGVSEAMNAADDEFEEERMIEAVRTAPGLNSSDLIDHIMRECDAFVAGAPQHDDMTLVVVRVRQ